jgi:hypothetical protein
MLIVNIVGTILAIIMGIIIFLAKSAEKNPDEQKTHH